MPSGIGVSYHRTESSTSAAWLWYQQGVAHHTYHKVWSTCSVAGQLCEQRGQHNGCAGKQTDHTKEPNPASDVDVDVHTRVNGEWARCWSAIAAVTSLFSRRSGGRHDQHVGPARMRAQSDVLGWRHRWAVACEGRGARRMQAWLLWCCPGRAQRARSFCLGKVA